MTYFKSLGASALILTSTAILASCTPVRETHGNFLKDYQIAQVEEGIDTRSDVVKKLGSPTTVSPFDETVWFYLGQKTVKKGIFDPKLKDERVVLVKFDETGAVQTVMEVEQDRLDIPLSDDKTKTGGNEIGILEQALGNLGKFNKNGGGTMSASDL